MMLIAEGSQMNFFDMVPSPDCASVSGNDVSFQCARQDRPLEGSDAASDLVHFLPGGAVLLVIAIVVEFLRRFASSLAGMID